MSRWLARSLRRPRQAVLGRAPEGTTDIGSALIEIARHVQADEFDDLVKAILAGRAGLAGILASKATVDAAILLLRDRLELAPGDDATQVQSELALSEPVYRRVIAALHGGSKGDDERATQIDGIIARPGACLVDLQDLYLTAKKEPRKLKGIATKAVIDANPWIENSPQVNRAPASGLASSPILSASPRHGRCFCLPRKLPAEYEPGSAAGGL